MVVQIEYLGKSRSGRQPLLPASLRTLGIHQKFDAVTHAEASGVAPGNEAQNRPGGLRGGAGGGDECPIVVTGAAFAPPAVGVLYAAQPFARAQDVRLAIALARGRQPAQREARAKIGRASCRERV